MAKIVSHIPGMPKTLLLIGDLEEIICTRKSKEHDITDFLLKSSDKKNLVCASSDGKLVVIVSPDTVEFIEQAQAEDFRKAVDLHTDFHGVEPPQIKKINTQPFNQAIYYGELKHIVYNVPQYSERRGVPFIHEAGDKGDDVPPAKVKPTVCYTPAKDMIIIYGPEMSFTDRGIIG